MPTPQPPPILLDAQAPVAEPAESLDGACAQVVEILARAARRRDAMTGSQDSNGPARKVAA